MNSTHICFLFIDIATVVLVVLEVGDFQTKGYLSSLIVTAFVFSSKSVQRSKGDSAVAVDKQLRDDPFNELFINVEKRGKQNGRH
jgi:hypothetical protein